MLLIRLLGVAVFATRLPIDSTAARRPVIILMEEKKRKKKTDGLYTPLEYGCISVCLQKENRGGDISDKIGIWSGKGGKVTVFIVQTPFPISGRAYMGGDIAAEKYIWSGKRGRGDSLINTVYVFFMKCVLFYK